MIIPEGMFPSQWTKAIRSLDGAIVTVVEAVRDIKGVAGVEGVAGVVGVAGVEGVVKGVVATISELSTSDRIKLVIIQFDWFE